MSIQEFFVQYRGKPLPVVEVHTPTFDTLQALRLREASAALVVEGSQPVGVASLQGFALFAMRFPQALNSSQVGEWMEKPLGMVPWNASASAALASLMTYDTSHVLVVRDRYWLGLLSLENVLRLAMREQAERIAHLQCQIRLLSHPYAETIPTTEEMQPDELREAQQHSPPSPSMQDTTRSLQPPMQEEGAPDSSPPTHEDIRPSPPPQEVSDSPPSRGPTTQQFSWSHLPLSS